jgi:hypothetical protein
MMALLSFRATLPEFWNESSVQYFWAFQAILPQRGENWAKFC